MSLDVFETVVVAARGATALRVVRTCQRLGVRAVAAHSEVDAGALPVREADDAVLLGPAPPEQSYLDPRRVVEAARQSGAQAVHPGSGALAHDPAAARAVLDAGLVWVGAPPEVLAALTGPGALSATATAAGLPLAEHAAAGRHLSLPVLVLPDGEVVVLPEVDCSVQRQAQALVAETPAPGLDDGMRRRLARCAAHVAGAVGLRGLGAVELALLPDGPALRAVTPALPVEHLVTELVTGLDLVEQQLLLAAGEPAAARPGPARGVAVGVRVYAEDPQRLVTAPGVLTRWSEPPGVRVDSGHREGDEVHAWYDPLLAKAAVHAATRGEALAHARAAVAAFVVEGVSTNLPVLARLLAEDGSASGRDDTALVPGL